MNLKKLSKVRCCSLCTKAADHVVSKEITLSQGVFSITNNHQQALLDEFVKVLENNLNLKRTAFSFRRGCSENSPAAANGRPLLEKFGQGSTQTRNDIPAQYLNTSEHVSSILSRRIHEYNRFRQDYQSAYGQEPYVDPIVRFRCYGTDHSITWVTRSRKIAGTLYPKTTRAERKQAEYKSATFRIWCTRMCSKIAWIGSQKLCYFCLLAN